MKIKCCKIDIIFIFSSFLAIGKRLVYIGFRRKLGYYSSVRFGWEGGGSGEWRFRRFCINISIYFKG